MMRLRLSQIGGAIRPPVLKDLVLLGGGHSHIAVLKSLGMQPLPGVRVTLISRDSRSPYSGMLPGFVAGHYREDEAHFDLVRLCRFAGARFVRGEVVGLDLAANAVAIAGRPALPFDVLSIDVGSTPALPERHGKDLIAVKPIDQFIAKWSRLLERLGRDGGRPKLAVVGAGAGGVELCLAADHRLRTLGVEASFELVTEGPDILTSHPRRVRARFRRILAARGITVHTDMRVVSAEAGRLRTADGRELAYDDVFWVTDATAAPWLAAAGLAVDAKGFVLVDRYLRSVSHPEVFAAGDAATMQATPRPKSGVFAVRQGRPLARNLRRTLLEQRLVAYRPQRRFLSLIGTGEGRAVASRGPFTAEGRWVWRWKDRIDRRFMRRYQALPAMSGAVQPRVPAVLARDFAPAHDEDGMRCGGCGAKVAAATLRAALAAVDVAPHRDVVVGLAAPDDAAIVAVPNGKLAVLSVDAFRPMIEDPYLFGRITANHCLGDLYAVGAEPQSALTIATLPLWPEAKLVAELVQLLGGAVAVFAEGGAALVGGHTSEGAELSLGFSVTGTVGRDAILHKTGLRPGDTLILTKPVGTGAILAADMRARARARWVDGAIEAMLQSSREAAACLRAHGAVACTDVTGFGVLGHLLEMIGTDALDLDLDLSALPVLEGAEEVLAAGIASTLHAQNERVTRGLAVAAALEREPRYSLLFDPQTAGGLLAGVPPERAAACLAQLAALGYGEAAVVATVRARRDAREISIESARLKV